MENYLHTSTNKKNNLTKRATPLRFLFFFIFFFTRKLTLNHTKGKEKPGTSPTASKASCFTQEQRQTFWQSVCKDRFGWACTQSAPLPGIRCLAKRDCLRWATKSKSQSRPAELLANAAKKRPTRTLTNPQTHTHTHTLSRAHTHRPTWSNL